MMCYQGHKSTNIFQVVDPETQDPPQPPTPSPQPIPSPQPVVSPQANLKKQRSRLNWWSSQIPDLLSAGQMLGQFGCGILKMVGPKMQDFCPRINMLRMIFFSNNPMMNHGLSKSAVIVLSKSIFYVKNRSNHSNFFFIEEHEIRSTTFINDTFCLMSFLKHFIY